MKKMMYALWMMCFFTIAASAYNDASAQEVKDNGKTKKGWSKKAKYSVAGGAVGAATGVAVSKKNTKGAVVGGAVGAGAGYIYGRHKDKKQKRKTTYKH